MAWESWQQWYAEHMDLMHRMRGAVNRMLKRKLSMAWEQWQFWYAEVKDQQFKLAGALRRMMNRKLSMAWEQWQFWYANISNGGDVKIFGAQNGTYMRPFANGAGALPCHSFPYGVNNNMDHDPRINHHHHESGHLPDPLKTMRYAVTDGFTHIDCSKTAHQLTPSGR